MRDKEYRIRASVLGIVVAFGWLVGAPARVGAVGGESAFVGLLPCRLVDTRGNGFGGAFGPPVLAAGVPRDFPLQGQCGIPDTALAVSLNVTATGTLGPGFFLLYPQGDPQPLVSTLNYLAGQTVANAAVVPLGPGGLTVVPGVAGADLILDVNGYFEDVLVHDVGLGNLFVGPAAGNLGTSGEGNTAVGANALQTATGGGGNTAVGFNALQTNTSGDFNTAVGASALALSSPGSRNTAIGNTALLLNFVGDSNTGIGDRALRENSLGSNSTAVGAQALVAATGSGNTAVGFQAGVNATTGSNNVYIASPGLAADSATTRIGADPVQTRAFIAGVRGVTTDTVVAIPVLIDSAGQLGTISSSGRAKEAIEPMGEASQALLRLRPVTFRYRQAVGDGTKPRQYGLIAEEVAEVSPDLVAYGADGQPETVLYHVLPVLLLNELQRQQRELTAKSREVDELRRRLDALEGRVTAGP